MKKLISLFLAIAFTSCAAPSLPGPDGDAISQSFSLIRADIGASLMDDDVIDDEKPMANVRLGYQFQEIPAKNGLPFGLVSQAGVFYGASSQSIDLDGLGAVNFDMEQYGLDAGIRLYQNQGYGPAIFIGFGGVLASTSFQDGTGAEDVTTYGAYVEVGADFRLSENSILGISVRHTGGMNGDINDNDVKLSNDALVISYGWGL